MASLEIQIKLAYSLILKILEEEDFQAYIDIKNTIEDCLTIIEDTRVDSCIEKISFCIRALMEAPPRNAESGFSLIIQLDEISRGLQN